MAWIGTPSASTSTASDTSTIEPGASFSSCASSAVACRAEMRVEARE